MKKTLWLLGLVSLIITMVVLVDTYGLFETNGSASSELSIGEWVILVNNTDISLSETINLNNFTYSTTTHTQDGYFAPGRTGEFNIVMDTTGADVSVEFEMEIDDSVLEDYPNISFSIRDTNTNTTVNSSTYSGVIYLTDANRVKTLTISLIWDDDPDYDESDTTLMNEAEFIFPIDINFKQYIPE